MNDQIISLVLLLHTRLLGRMKIRKLIQEFGSPENVVKAGWNASKRLLFEKWEVTGWEEDLNAVEKEKILLLSYLDPFYPKSLLSLADFPLLLYVKGELKTSDSEAGVALIGTRNATLYGKQMAEKLAKEVVAQGGCVISGMARGIDTAAHYGALEGGGRTVAVLGSGILDLYPKENRSLAEKIAASGALISEYPMRTPPSKGSFPQRNRIISGLAQSVCLIESPQKGGAMLTMAYAEEQRKPQFAIPGRLDCPTFEGNFYLLKHKKVTLAARGNELLENCKITQNQPIKSIKSPHLTPAEESFLALLPAEEKSIEELVLLTQLPVMQLNVFLTRLVLKKAVKEFPGKTYKKIGGIQ